jgi:hypothetical protein
VIRSFLLLLSLPFAAGFAQSAPIHVLVTSLNQASFQVSISPRIRESPRSSLVGVSSTRPRWETCSVLPPRIR